MINISARGFELKQGTKDGIESELKRIEKMLPENARFDVTLTKERDDYECDITVRHIGSFIRGEARAERIEPVVDAAVDDLKRKLRKLKTFFVDKKRKGGIDEIADAIDEIDDEAIVQMEMLGHTFFVYLGIDGETKIVYKCKSGYGVLICEE